MATAKKDIEYQYYSRKCAANGITISQNAPLVDFKKAYWAKATGAASNQTTASDLEYNWLGTLTGVTGKTLQDRWREAFVGLGTGLAAPATLEEIQTMFYMLAP